MTNFSTILFHLLRQRGLNNAGFNHFRFQFVFVNFQPLKVAKTPVNLVRFLSRGFLRYGVMYLLSDVVSA